MTRLDKDIGSLDDLINQYKVKYSTIKNSPEYFYFQRMAKIEKEFFKTWKDISMNDSLNIYERSELAVWEYPLSTKYTKIWDMMNSTNFPVNLEEARQWVQNSTPSSGYAFIGDATDVKYLSMTNCDLEKIGEEFSKRPYGVAVQQGSPLKDELDTR